MKYHFQKKFKVPIYIGDLIVCVSNDLEKVIKINPNLKNESEIYGSSSCFDFRGKTTYMIVLNLDHSHCNLRHGDVSHEAVHVAEFIFEDIGASHDLNNPEPFTYLVGWVANRCYEVVEMSKMNHKLSSKKILNKPNKTKPNT